jgi:hypothetical protein
MKKYFCLLLTITAIFPVSAQNLPSRSEIIQKLLGQWDWVSSSGGFAGTTITPKSTGYTLKETFSMDASDSVWSILLKNDSLVRSSLVRIDTITPYYPHEKIWALGYAIDSFLARLSMQIASISDTALSLDENLSMSDGYSSLYKKIAQNKVVPRNSNRIIIGAQRNISSSTFFNSKGQRLEPAAINNFEVQRLVIKMDKYSDGTICITKTSINGNKIRQGH